MEDLEKLVTKVEIKNVVFFMNTDNAPRLDGFPIGFY